MLANFGLRQWFLAFRDGYRHGRFRGLPVKTDEHVGLSHVPRTPDMLGDPLAVGRQAHEGTLESGLGTRSLLVFETRVTLTSFGDILKPSRRARTVRRLGRSGYPSGLQAWSARELHRHGEPSLYGPTRAPSGADHRRPDSTSSEPFMQGSNVTLRTSGSLASICIRTASSKVMTSPVLLGVLGDRWPKGRTWLDQRRCACN